ncbi:MAG: ABC transporter C-terminal domain-containing protein [Xanthobacteraceae bacterium]
MTNTDRTVKTGLSSGAAWRLLARRRRTYVILMVLIVIAGLIGHIIGRELGRRNLLARDETIQQLRNERLELNAELGKRNDRLSELQTKLNQVQATLDELMPSENIYVFRPNQSLALADGRVTVGLMGSPANQNVTLNVSGKQHVAVAGDVIKVPLEESTTCQVVVQSFDPFKAIIQATCSGKTP